MNCCICNKQVGIDAGCSKEFRHTWTRINGVCRYVTICNECYKGREWCNATKKEEALLEKERAKERKDKGLPPIQKKKRRKRK